jgi:flavin reductase (DIM6/NTAB) family NADH-FMN oxidoreductase RutF
MSSAAFKEAMSRFASGVTVLCGRAGGALHGMTVAAFSSVSAEPPVVLVCLGTRSTLGGGLREGDPATVSILGAGSEALALRFAGMDGHAGDRFEGVATESSAVDLPVLAGAEATLACVVRAAHEVGDHRVLYLDVHEVRASTEAGTPLLWWSRGFARAVRSA